MSEEENVTADPDAEILAWLSLTLADPNERPEYRVMAANILIAHTIKWNSGRGMASGVASYEKVNSYKISLREMVLGKLVDAPEDALVEARLMAARSVLL